MKNKGNEIREEKMADEQKVENGKSIHLREALENAEGRSEFVIVVVADIRGFSNFSKKHESPDAAMYIRRVYIELIDKYFSKANFFKPTGDGLLMTFPYNRKTLEGTASYVLNACFDCLINFPSICTGDPMINFDVPQNIGFGITRGTACCLYAADEILDYSGHLLNLATRLMDLARPSGIVVDGNFGKDIIQEYYCDNFTIEQVFIRNLAEVKSIDVFYLKDFVEIPENALAPLKGDSWDTILSSFTVHELKKSDLFVINLPVEAKSTDKIKITLLHPHMKCGKIVKDLRTLYPFTKYEYSFETGESQITLNFKFARNYLEKKKVPRTRKVTFKIQYVPKHPIEQ